MPKAKYSVIEARFFVELGVGPKVYLEYMNRRTGELKKITIPTKEIHEKLNIEINDFLVDIVDRYENVGGE